MLFADNTQIIQVTLTQAVVGAIGLLIAIGAAWGTLKTSVRHISKSIDEIKDDIKDTIKPDLKDVRERLSNLEGRQSGLVQANSPMGLTTKGRKALDGSGLKEYIDSHKDKLMSHCEEHGSMDSPYDIQECAIDFFSQYAFPPNIEKQLKDYAYEHGNTLDGMRLVAGIYFRDLCLSERGIDPKELDKPQH